ncbi:hypothetical protein H9L13_03075 [Sphingomonas lutea]|uniref:Putative Flp pilus-assembly TadG-like N-terminal domain-containing protein n=1 Tax=Sphingomonas lutea TaxID=1045317 RepID=A0A7G9SJ92_9SPHN|nr:pilus assembly protein TadG-related protein [Sphingomonas lutea]QNN67917.1 hypothetical protein H9L13_03075 [Sphingomonas lutea]
MIWGTLRKLWTQTDGAVAPTVALSMVGLIAAGGLAFDYARLVTMDTELQQAADQAALAAATQLDRSDNAITNATAAVSVSGSNQLALNLTRFSNDSVGRSVSVTLTFCEEFDDSIATNAAACTETTDPNDSRFVIATTALRTANYAFTPIVGLMSGTAQAHAVAGVESSICNVAPLLVCTPSDDFPTEADVGRGIILKTAGGNAWAPGNYGFLDFGNGNPAVINALLGNGLNGCQATDDNETEPGNKNATDAINTRMDVYAGTQKNEASKCTPSTGASCPAENTRKDMTLQMTFEIRVDSSAAAPTPPACGSPEGGNVNSGGKTSYTADFAQHGPARQFGRDSCHYTGTCPVNGGAQNFGDKAWDRDGYLAANHPGIDASAVAAALGGGATASTLTRYQVYQWEIANKATGKLDPRQIGAVTQDPPDTKGSNTTYKFYKQCSFSQPRFATAASAAAKDRRVLPIVAANCDELKGKGTAFEDYIILRAFDIFLTEPSLQRSAAQTGIAGATLGTDDKEIYGEVIGPAKPVGGGNGFQYYTRARPYLIR